MLGEAKPVPFHGSGEGERAREYVPFLSNIVSLKAWQIEGGKTQHCSC